MELKISLESSLTLWIDVYEAAKLIDNKIKKKEVADLLIKNDLFLNKLRPNFKYSYKGWFKIDEVYLHDVDDRFIKRKKVVLASLKGVVMLSSLIKAANRKKIRAVV